MYLDKISLSCCNYQKIECMRESLGKLLWHNPNDLTRQLQLQSFSFDKLLIGIQSVTVMMNIIIPFVFMKNCYIFLLWVRIYLSSLGWGCRIHQLHFSSGVTPCPPCDCPGYDIKLSDGKALALVFWGIWSTPSLPSLPGPLWPRVVVPHRVLSMGQIELFDI